MLQSITIERFRGFARLDLKNLGRVNLIVGKNNTGKTSLLEAISLLADPTRMIGQLPGLFRANAGPVDERFYRWLPKDGTKDAEIELSAVTRSNETRRVVLTQSQEPNPASTSTLKHVWGSTLRLFFDGGLSPMTAHAVSVQHRLPDDIVDAFAEAVRSPDDEGQMESLLHSVDSRIRTVRLDSVKSKPFIVVDVSLSERIPLSQAGQGIYRLVSIFSELLGNKPKICFIDELEDGIHYSALPQVWKGIAEVAERLDVQIFATTHSWECLVSAHETFVAREAYDFRVTQLYRLNGETSGRVLDRQHIEAAIAGEIDLR
jgi:hypothetical protein